MHPLSDKDLDRLSREAAEHYDVDQNTSGWEQLEQRLNKHLPEKGRKERRRFLFFIWLLALLSGGGLLWMLTGNGSPRLITLKQRSAGLVETPDEKKITHQALVEDKTKKESEFRDEDEKTDDHSLSVRNKESIVKDKIDQTLSENANVEKTGSSGINKDVPNNKNLPAITQNGSSGTGLIVSRKLKKNPVDAKDRSTARVVSASSRVPASAEGSDKENKEVGTTSGPGEPVKNIPAPLGNQATPNDNQPVDSSKQMMAEQTQTATDTVSILKKISLPKNKSGFKKGFEIGIIAAPDMSNVKFTNTDKVGFNVGVQIAYRITPRWSLNTGAIYTRKNYTSQGKDFNPPKGSWIDNVRLNEVEGNCSMFDIPLNVRYDLNSGNNHRYFISTGLSTYLMKKEDYHYHYQYPNGSAGYRYRSHLSSEHHWLSILNISAGFEKKLTKRLSLQAEPFLKIPLAGVGYGNLKLNSYGMYFLLKFQANKR